MSSRLNKYTTDQIIDSLPQNRSLYKDSGLWQIRTDDMENIFMQQTANETFREFIIRYAEFIAEYDQDEAYHFWVELTGKSLQYEQV